MIEKVILFIVALYLFWASLKALVVFSDKKLNVRFMDSEGTVISKAELKKPKVTYEQVAGGGLITIKTESDIFVLDYPLSRHQERDTIILDYLGVKEIS